MIFHLKYMTKIEYHIASDEKLKDSKYIETNGDVHHYLIGYGFDVFINALASENDWSKRYVQDGKTITPSDFINKVHDTYNKHFFESYSKKIHNEEHLMFNYDFNDLIKLMNKIIDARNIINNAGQVENSNLSVSSDQLNKMTIDSRKEALYKINTVAKSAIETYEKFLTERTRRINEKVIFSSEYKGDILYANEAGLKKEDLLNKLILRDLKKEVNKEIAMHEIINTLQSKTPDQLNDLLKLLMNPRVFEIGNSNQLNTANKKAEIL